MTKHSNLKPCKNPTGNPNCAGSVSANSRTGLCRSCAARNSKKPRKFKAGSERAREAGRKGGKARGNRVGYERAFAEVVTEEDFREVADVILQAAKGGNLRACQMIQEHGMGKPPQRVDLRTGSLPDGDVEGGRETLDAIEAVYDPTKAKR